MGGFILPARRFVALCGVVGLLGMSLGVVSTAVQVAAGLVPEAAAAPPLPSSVSEFQPLLNNTNPGGPANGGRWGGRTVSVSISPADANDAIAASESGGLFRTTDNGAKWTHLDALKPFRMADVKYATNNASLVIATAFRNGDTENPGGIWRSTDGGTTWSQPGSAATLCGAVNSFSAWGVAFEPSSNNVYVGVDCGLAVSTNGGATWTLRPLANGAVSVVAQAGGIVDTCSGGDGHRRFQNIAGTLTLINGPNQIGGTGCNGAPSIHTLAAAPQQNNVLVAMVSNTQSTTLCGGTATTPAGTVTLYESDDAGLTWTSLAQMCRARPPWLGTHLSRDGDVNHFDVFYSGGLNTARFTCDASLAGNRCAGAPSGPNVSEPHADPSEVAWPPGSNCPRYIPSDAGMAAATSTNTADCGNTFAMVAGSGTAAGGYNALQLYEVTGQVHPGDHTDLYFGTQDNDIWASSDNGANWNSAVCCEGFFFETPHSQASDANQVITAVICGPCSNQVFRAHYQGCNYNPCGTSWTEPPLPATGPQNPPTVKPDNPFLIEPNVYLESGIFDNAGNRAFYIGTVNPTTLGVTWTGPVQAQGGGNFLLSQPISNPAYITGPPGDPTVYYTYNRGGSTGLLSITGLRTNNAQVNILDAGLNGIAGFCNGQGTFVCPSVIGVDPANPLHLFAVDTVGANSIQVMESTDGGANWAADTQLTNLVLDNGRFRGIDPNSGSQVHKIQFDPVDSNRILVGTESNGIIASTDGGVTWAKMTGSEQVTGISDFFFDEVNNEILVSSYGRGLWKLDLPTADLSITKTDTPDPATAGGELFYDITVANDGPDAAPTVVVTDTLPAEVTYVTNDLPDPSACATDFNPAGETVTCNLGGLASGDSISFRIKVAVDSDAVAFTGPRGITNTATVNAPGVTDPDTTDNTAVATTIVEDSADLEINKLCKPDTSIPAGTPVDCTMFVDNHGPSFARGVVVDDTILSNGTFTVSNLTSSQGVCSPVQPVIGGQRFSCLLGPLANATTTNTGRATVTYTITANEAQDVNNVGTVRSDTPDPDSTNNTAIVSLTVSALADLALTKTASAASVVAGTNLSYSLSATNNGPSTATNVHIDDILPDGVTLVSVSGPGGSCTAGTPGDPFQPTTCAYGSLPPGGSVSMTVVVHVEPATTGIIHNEARVASDTFDGNSANDLAHTDTPVTTDADLAVTKSATPNPVAAGTALSYQITVTNNGPSRARGITLTDPLASVLVFSNATVSGIGGSCGLQTNTNVVQCQLPDLDPGQSAVVFIYTTVASSAGHNTTITNTATVSTTSGDSVPANNSATITTQVIRRSDLAILLTSDLNVYKPSSIIHYEITVTNLGPSDADNVVVTQALPDSRTGFYDSNDAGCPPPVGQTFTCGLGTIASGGTRTFDLNFMIRGNKRTVTSTATVASASTDPVPANNTSTRVVTVK